jgi:hypothetical protein
MPVAPAEAVAALPEPELVAAPVSVAPPVVGSAAPSNPEVDLGAPLAAEVAFIDRARASLASGQAAQGISQLASYEQSFPEARLLPEVLFLRLDGCERLGRHAEARAAAERLVQGFPKSPHAARARKLLAR